MARELYYTAQAYRRGKGPGSLLWSHTGFRAESRALAFDHARYCALVDTGYDYDEMTIELQPITRQQFDEMYRSGTAITATFQKK